MSNNVNRNKCLNIIYKYSARIIEVTNKWFTANLILKKNEKLVKDLNKLFFIKRIGRRRVQNK